MALRRMLALPWLGAEAWGEIWILEEGSMRRRIAVGAPAHPPPPAQLPDDLCPCRRPAPAEPAFHRPSRIRPRHWCLPLRHSGQLLGIAVLHPGPGAPAARLPASVLQAVAAPLAALVARHLQLATLCRLWVAVEQAPTAVIITDADGRIEYVNEAFCKLSGFELDELHGRNPRILNSGRQPRAFYEALWRTIAAGRTWEGEFCNRRRDGTLYWSAARIAPVRDAAGAIRHYVGMSVDITTLKAERERAEARRRLLEAVAESMDEGMLVFDAGLRLQFYNRRYLEQWPVPAELLDRHPAPEEIIHALARAGIYPQEMVERIIRKRLDSFRDPPQKWVRTPRTDDRHVEVSVRRLPDGGVLLLSRDVTDRVHQHEALLRRVGLERTVARIARTLLATERLEDGLHSLVHHLHLALGADAVLLYLREWSRPEARLAARWPATHAQQFAPERLVPEDAPGIIERLRRGEMVELQAAPQNATPEQRMLHGAGMAAARVFPVRDASGVLQGGLVLAWRHPADVCAAEDHHALWAVAEMLGAHLHRLATAERLRRSEERYALTARGANDGLWDWDLESERIYYSPRWHEILGYPPGEEPPARIETWLSHILAEDRPLFERSLQAHLEGRTPRFVTEVRIRRCDGEVRWVLVRGVAVRRADGRPTRVAGSMSDITDRHRAQEQLLHDAFHDGLTDLPNRALLEDRLQAALAGRQRRRRRPAILLVDLDRFRLLNESLGHKVGDVLLQRVAARLRESVRPGDTVARISGDEFAVLLEDSGPGEAEGLARRLLEAFTRPFHLGRRRMHSEISIGLVIDDGRYRAASEMLRDADTALHQAKSRGRGRFVVFRREMHRRVHSLLTLGHALRDAIDNDRIRLVYQPVVEVGSHRIAAFEALARWEHPRRGTVPPGEFIPLAEETGLILPLGWRILERACREAARWRRLPDPPGVAVNISAIQLAQDDFPGRVLALLDECGLPPSMLRLELTESVFLAEDGTASGHLARLRRSGVRLLLDDFGTGYSSLSYLEKFPIDTVKLDRAFLRGVASSAQREEFVRNLIVLLRGIGKEIVAEGVETAEQLEALRRCGCPLAQGFLFAPPVPPQQAGELAARGRCVPGCGG